MIDELVGIRFAAKAYGFLSSQSKPKRALQKPHADLPPPNREKAMLATVIQVDTGSGEGREGRWTT